MTRPVMSVNLYRENVHVRPPSVVSDVGWLVMQSTLGFLVLYILAVLVMA